MDLVPKENEIDICVFESSMLGIYSCGEVNCSYLFLLTLLCPSYKSSRYLNADFLTISFTNFLNSSTGMSSIVFFSLRFILILSKSFFINSHQSPKTGYFIWQRYIFLVISSSSLSSICFKYINLLDVNIKSIGRAAVSRYKFSISVVRPGEMSKYMYNCDSRRFIFQIISWTPNFVFLLWGYGYRW